MSPLTDEDNHRNVLLIGFTSAVETEVILPGDACVFQTEVGLNAIIVPNSANDNALQQVADIHEALIICAKSSTVLPVRIGSLIPATDLVKVCREHLKIYQQFAGACEIRIKAKYDEDKVIDIFSRQLERHNTTDKISLGQLVARLLSDQREIDTRMISSSLGSVVDELKVEAGKDDWDVAAISLLASDDQIERIETVLNELVESKLNYVTFELTAPLPIYSFV